MGNAEIAIISALVAVLAKMLDIAHKYITEKFNKKQPEEELSNKLDIIIKHVEGSTNMQSSVDNEGIPLMYSPRVLVEVQKQNAELLRDSQMIQKHMCESLDKVSDRLESVSKILSVIEDRIKR